jgi:hypothetical protein
MVLDFVTAFHSVAVAAGKKLPAVFSKQLVLVATRSKGTVAGTRHLPLMTWIVVLPDELRHYLPECLFKKHVGLRAVRHAYTGGWHGLLKKIQSASYCASL